MIACTKQYFEEFILPRSRKQAEDPKAFLFFDEPAPKTYSVKSNKGKNEAIIDISGELSNNRYFGTSYSDIKDMILKADNNPDVDRIVLEINSPGGNVNGVEDTARVIKSAKKEVVARVGYMAASAAYWLASQADRIEATSKMAVFGSIGVIVSYYDWKEYFDKAGIKEIVITSTEAPKKNIDPATDEGRSEILTRLDKIHSVFVESVASGRKISTEKVNSDFGKGGIMLAEDALKVGMIDGITVGNITDNSEDYDMTRTYTQEEYDSGIKAVSENLLKHAKFFGRAKNETVIANMEANKPFADCVEGYCAEELAAKLLEQKVNANEPENHGSKDRALVEKTEKAKNDEKTVEILKSWEAK